MQKITYGIHDTEIGKIVIGQSDKALCWLGFMVEGYKGNGLDRMKGHFPGADFTRDDSSTAALMQRIIKAWKADDLKSVPLDLKGTAFQISVWNALLNIPAGSVKSYHDVAKEIDRPKAMRAVGTAVGSNPVSLIVPCHRVVQSSGALGNYGWGVDLKEKLLDLETQNIAHTVKAA